MASFTFQYTSCLALWYAFGKYTKYQAKRAKSDMDVPMLMLMKMFRVTVSHGLARNGHDQTDTSSVAGLCRAM